MNTAIQTAYLMTSFIGVVAMIPQIRRLIATKQSDELSLVTWATWGCCQLMSFVYAISIHATAYMIVNVAWISFYAIMVFLIVKYRKRRSLVSTLFYWHRRGREQSSSVPLQLDTLPGVLTVKKL